MKTRLYWALAAPALCLAPGATIHAQGEDAERIEEVIVTGSRIPRSDLDGVAPVTVYTAADIDRSGATSIGQILREIPSVAGGAQTTQVNNGGGGIMQISLRGMGAVRTLVLLNGRRVTASVDSGANGISVDLNTIPTSVIKRIEVLKDGASAVYGSDAIAGVVNIITKKNHEGFELSTYWGDTTRGGGSRAQVDLVAGGGGEDNNWLFVASTTDEEQIEVTDRKWAMTPLFYAAGDVIFLGSSAPPWGRYRSFTEAAANRDCNGDGTIGTNNCDLTLGPEYGSDFRTFNYFGGDSYNYAPANYQRQPNHRWSLSFFGETGLGALTDVGVLGEVSGYLEATYTNRESRQKLAEVPLAPLAFFGYAAPYSKDNYYNPLGVDIPDWRRRMVEGGSRMSPNEENTIRLLLGVRGEWVAGALDGWTWDANMARGESRRTVHFGHIYNLQRVGNAVGPTTGSPATNDLACVNDPANCVPLNTFGENSVTQEMIDYITFTTNEEFSLEQQMFALQFSTPALVDLPAGPMGVALGFEFRDQSAADVPDSQVAALGDSATGTPRQPTSGGYDVREAYVELVVPLVADRPWAESLELEAAVRYSNYDAFGATTNPKIGWRWRPMGDLVIRGSMSSAFRAPNVGELYGGAGSSFPSLSDPCSGGRVGGNVCQDPRVPDAGFEIISTQIRTRVGGNASLTPEEADILTVGLVWTPESIAGMSLALDYYQYELMDAIGGLGADFILNSCAKRGELCDRIARFPDGNVRQLDNRTANANGLESSGVDVAAAYTGIVLPKGELDVRLDLTRVLAHDLIQPDGTVIEHAGWFRDEQDGHFGEWKAIVGLRYQLNDRFNVTWDLRYIDDVAEEYEDQFTSENLERTLEGRIYHDVQTNWSFELGDVLSTLTVGVDNVLDEDPSFSLDGFNDNTDVRTFDTAGRFAYARLRLSL